MSNLEQCNANCAKKEVSRLRRELEASKQAKQGFALSEDDVTANTKQMLKAKKDKAALLKAKDIYRWGGRKRRTKKRRKSRTKKRRKSRTKKRRKGTKKRR